MPSMRTKTIIPPIKPYAMEYVRGISITVTKADRAWECFSLFVNEKKIELYSLVPVHFASRQNEEKNEAFSYQLIFTRDLVMSAPTIIKAPPVAQAGILARIGAKKMLKKKKNAQITAVSPVLEPASTPAALSMYEVTGLRPKQEPIMVAMASAENAQRLLGKSPFSST